MTKRMLCAVVCGLVMTGGAGVGAGLSAAPVAQTAPAVKPVIPVKVDVTIMRFQGEKKTSSLPFSLMVNANAAGGENRTSLRMGVEIPAGANTTKATDGTVTTTPAYHTVGTNIDARADSTDDGRFKVYVSVNDSAIFTADADTKQIFRATDPAAFRNFQTSQYLTMKDGQAIQFTMATDKVTGEVLKVEVTLTVLK